MSSTKVNWTDSLLDINASIEDAIKKLNDSSLRIVLILNEAGILEGTISDGDIRRGLLRGLTLASPVSTIIHRNSLVVPPEMGREMVLQLMTANRIHQIPIVDVNQMVVGLHLWDEMNSQKTYANRMLIMAGGRGVRLHPQTEICPKPLLRIAGRPILEHIIERAKSEGFVDFIISIHYLGNMIEEYFGNGEKFGVKIEYLRETSPLGTAGALRLLTQIPTSPIIITNGDVITNIKFADLLNFHESYESIATMAVRSYEWQNSYGVVQTQGIEIVDYEEKPVLHSNINAGVYVLQPAALKFLPESSKFDMPLLFKNLRSNDQRTIAYPIHEKWIDVGQPIDLARANSEF